jgi:hypothetical protein
MQVVFLSARPDVLAGTWRLMRRHMPWVGPALVVCPARLAHGVRLDDACTVLTDEELTGSSASALADLDHTSRNTLLRRRLADCAAVDEEFLMSDDDYRPMRHVPRSFFGPPGRHRMRYFYDLRQWAGCSTSFDEAQHRTAEILGYLRLPTRSYGSHLPQPIWRSELSAAFATIRTLVDSDLVCEWSVYANVAMAASPERFVEPAPFSTLCWPQYRGEWSWWIEPEAPPHFENHYPELYEPGHLFAGIPPEPDEGDEERYAFERWSRWWRAGDDARALEFGDTWDPWTRGSPVRRAAFAALRAARRGVAAVR